MQRDNRKVIQLSSDGTCKLYWIYACYLKRKASKVRAWSTGKPGNKGTRATTKINENVIKAGLDLFAAAMGWFQKGYYFSLDFFMQCGVQSLLGTSGIQTGHSFTWLVCGSFVCRHGSLFTDCIV